MPDSLQIPEIKPNFEILGTPQGMIFTLLLAFLLMAIAISFSVAVVSGDILNSQPLVILLIVTCVILCMVLFFILYQVKKEERRVWRLEDKLRNDAIDARDLAERKELAAKLKEIELDSDDRPLFANEKDMEEWKRRKLYRDFMTILEMTDPKERDTKLEKFVKGLELEVTKGPTKSSRRSLRN